MPPNKEISSDNTGDILFEKDKISRFKV